jgi:hypothetical protein
MFVSYHRAAPRQLAWQGQGRTRERRVTRIVPGKKEVNAYVAIVEQM